MEVRSPGREGRGDKGQGLLTPLGVRPSPPVPSRQITWTRTDRDPGTSSILFTKES